MLKSCGSLKELKQKKLINSTTVCMRSFENKRVFHVCYFKTHLNHEVHKRKQR